MDYAAAADALIRRKLLEEMYDKMTDDDKNMLPLKRISFLGNNE